MEREEAIGLPPFCFSPSWGSSSGASPFYVSFFKWGSLIPRKVQKLPGASPFGTASRGGKIVYLRNMIFCISDILIRCNYAIIILYNSGIIIGKNFPLTEWDGSQTWGEFFPYVLKAEASLLRIIASCIFVPTKIYFASLRRKQLRSRSL